MLHEQIRTYKRELYETQAANTAHDRHIVRLQGEVKRLHAALQASLQTSSQHSEVLKHVVAATVCSPPTTPFMLADTTKPSMPKLNVVYAGLEPATFSV